MDNQTNYRNCVLPEAGVAERRNTFCTCSLQVICLFAFLLAFAAGLALGAWYSVIILAALPAVVTFAVVMAVLIASTLILRYCMCRRNCCCR